MGCGDPQFCDVTSVTNRRFFNSRLRVTAGAAHSGYACRSSDVTRLPARPRKIVVSHAGERFAGIRPGHYSEAKRLITKAIERSKNQHAKQR
jgi:hypothetical protein